MERLIESFILGTRWLLLPLYLALLLSVCGIYVMVGRELVHVVATLPEMTESEFILAVLAVLDLVLIANLLLMVGVSSYEATSRGSRPRGSPTSRNGSASSTAAMSRSRSPSPSS